MDTVWTGRETNRRSSRCPFFARLLQLRLFAVLVFNLSEKAINRATWEAKPQVVEPWQLIHGKSASLAWVNLTTICKAKLDGRIDIGLHPSERNSLAITPSGILPTLFARLWPDCLHQDADTGMVRLCQRPGCENPIADGTRADALYCNDSCQKADSRWLLHLSSAGV